MYASTFVGAYIDMCACISISLHARMHFRVHACIRTCNCMPHKVLELSYCTVIILKNHVFLIELQMFLLLLPKKHTNKQDPLTVEILYEVIYL